MDSEMSKMDKMGEDMVSSINKEQQENATYNYSPSKKTINKHIFIWIGTFLFGNLGVDRFLRGQIGLGILKLLTAGAFGIWTMVDFIIALVKIYGNSLDTDNNVTFINGKYTC